jgi:hypothetical protein
MQNGHDAMNVAMRVLTALMAKRRPDAVDVETLRSLAAKVGKDISVDELACDVIEAVLKDQAEARRQARTLV